ncbi:hypothetical protein [uncultured Prevotella sp.]|uniref:hypothetical protein n=1 Tax=uncultured Prevotella sp. TaxID=159272 RepID=UPI0025D1D717|nr:hypothetical protein [uncultured Prevotella sp.]
MEKNIKVLDLLGPDIRSHSNAGAIEKIIKESGNRREKHKGSAKIIKLHDMASLDLYFSTF